MIIIEIARLKKNIKNGYILGLLGGFILFGLYIGITIKDFYHVNSNERATQIFSSNGEKYLHKLQDNTTENGFFIWENIAPKELKKAWEKRSKTLEVILV